MTAVDSAPHRCALSVNLNKVATVRNTRHLPIPSLVRAAQACLQAGAQGLTVHPRPDERHIRLQDVFDIGTVLLDWPGREFNIEGNPFHNLLDVAHQVRQRGLPLHQLTFVPDSVGQSTSDHGWCFPDDAQRLIPVVAQAHALGARVSLFMDADAPAMAAARATGADRIELYTEPYAAAHAQGHALTWTQVLARYHAAAQAAHHQGLGINAGHDLNRDNLPAFLSGLPQVQEVSIGHAFIADALELGYAGAVQAYFAAIA
jgi:pyridoxine 5-phosphate synthase